MKENGYWGIIMKEGVVVRKILLAEEILGGNLHTWSN